MRTNHEHDNSLSGTAQRLQPGFPNKQQQQQNTCKHEQESAAMLASQLLATQLQDG